MIHRVLKWWAVPLTCQRWRRGSASLKRPPMAALYIMCPLLVPVSWWSQEGGRWIPSLDSIQRQKGAVPLSLAGWPGHSLGKNDPGRQFFPLNTVIVFLNDLHCRCHLVRGAMRENDDSIRCTKEEHGSALFNLPEKRSLPMATPSSCHPQPTTYFATRVVVSRELWHCPLLLSFIWEWLTGTCRSNNGWSKHRRLS